MYDLFWLRLFSLSLPKKSSRVICLRNRFSRPLDSPVNCCAAISFLLCFWDCSPRLTLNSRLDWNDWTMHGANTLSELTIQSLSSWSWLLYTKFTKSGEMFYPSDAWCPAPGQQLQFDCQSTYLSNLIHCEGVLVGANRQLFMLYYRSTLTATCPW